MIREEEKTDEEGIRNVHRESFPTGLEARIVDQLRSHENLVLSVVCVERGAVAGHVAYSPVQLVGQPVRGLGLGPVAVLPDSRGQGIAASIIEFGLKLALDRGFDFVVVLGDPEYYKRFGFRMASTLGLENEYGVDREFMVLELETGSLNNRTGLIQYGAEFSEA